MDLSSTLSNTISKQTVLENTSMTYASLEDAKKRENDAISNERIKNGDTILDTYEVTSDAISGGMGSVWRVHHQSWNTDLAMKRPQSRFFAEGSDKRKEQFIAECENWINLGLHPNIVSCYYVREIGGVPTIFSEWMDNGSLKDRISDRSLYEGTKEEVQERILDIAIQAARGLQYSHENGLIHQDMKPGNLLLSKEWDAKVADFGLAKAKEQLDNQSETAKTTGYTLAYCPKEQSEGKAPEKWMDVYAWAVTVLEMYAGKRLWDTGAEAKECFDEFPEQCAHTIPNKMAKLLKACLWDKPDGFADMRDQLLKIYVGLFGSRYEQKFPSVDTVTAENLNNKALSMIDLGKPEYAAEIWEQAHAVQPEHVVSAYNKYLYLWSIGELKNDEAVQKIENVLAFGAVSEEEKQELSKEMCFLLDPTSITQNVKLELSKYLHDADFDADGNLWAVVDGGELRRYDTKTGEQLFAKQISNKIITAMAIHPSGRYIYFADREHPDSMGNVRLFSVDLENDFEVTLLLEPFLVQYISELWFEEDDQVLYYITKTQSTNPFTDEIMWKSEIRSLELADQPNSSTLLTRPKASSKLERQTSYIRDWHIRNTSYGGTDYMELGCKDDACVYRMKGGKAYTVSSDGRFFIMRSSAYYVVPVPTKKKPEYRMNRIKEIAEIAKIEERARAFKDDFYSSFSRKDYSAAISAFEKHRDCAGKRDANDTIEMEKVLSGYCKRIGIHHSVAADKPKKESSENTRIDWKYPVGSFNNDAKCPPLKKKDFSHFSHKSIKQIFSFVKEREKSGELCYFVAERFDRSQIVILTVKAQRAESYQSICTVYLLDLETDDIRQINCIADQPMEVEIKKKDRVVTPPDYKIRSASNVLQAEKMKILLSPDGKWFDDVSALGMHAFSPDSRFSVHRIWSPIWGKSPVEIQYLEEKKESFMVDSTTLVHGDLWFSADGFCICDDDNAYRISYHYALPENADWDAGAEWYIRFQRRKERNLPEDESAMDKLMEELQNRGYGFLKREKVIEYIRQHPVSRL